MRFRGGRCRRGRAIGKLRNLLPLYLSERDTRAIRACMNDQVDAQLHIGEFVEQHERGSGHRIAADVGVPKAATDQGPAQE
jgi:hypothetical protein